MPAAAAETATDSKQGGRRLSRRVSGTHNRDLGMDKLQSEYEALQQKLALLKRDSSRDGGKLQQSTPMASIPGPRLAAAAGAAAAGGDAPPSGVPIAEPAPVAPDSTIAGAAVQRPGSCSGDTGPLSFGSMSVLQSCENLQLTCSIPDAGGVLQSLKFLAKHPGSRMAQLAESSFGDAEFVQLCEQGLTAQLQRTRDGATAQSRIAELAGLVKVLRRCVRDMAGKSSSVVEMCVKAEKEMNQELEKVRLDSEAAQRRMEAEVAQARVAVAQAESMYKSERAQWVTSLDAQKFEVARLQREMEGLEEQRTRAREEARKAEHARQQLEQEIKELRKASGQQLREVQVVQGEAVKQLQDEQQQAKRKEAQLKADNEQLEASLAAATAQVSKLQAQLSSLSQLQEGLQASLEGKQSAEESLMTQLTQTRAALDAAEASVAALSADKATLQQELSSSRDKVMLLESELKLKTSRMEAAQQQLASEAQEHQAKQALLQKQLEQHKADKDEARSQHAAAVSELEALSQQLATASTAKSQAESAAEELQATHDALLTQHAALQTQLREVEEASAAAAARAEELSAAMEASEEALSEARALTAQQASRLSHLESEFEALQEVMGEGEQRDIVGRLLSRISNLQAAAVTAEATRRQLHNAMVELRGNIRVFCRVRPHPQSVVRCLAGGSSLSLALDSKEHQFNFDKVFGPGTQQQQVFDSVCELVQSALDGYHVCLFSYGQTGAGKTFTMSGGPTPEQQGIMPRAVQQILASVAQLTEQEWQYTLTASCIEVYNNQLRDLLADGAGSRPDAGRISDPNAIKHDAGGGHTIVQGAMRVPVTDAESAAVLMARAAEARACEATAMNAVSSRSHCVFMLYIAASHAATNTHLTGSLCLVDLAGSERLDRSMVEDMRKREACSINQSLSALGDVFAALSSKTSHIPYRNSKLTYLLQPCLGGHGKTLMFVHINPEPASAQESLCSLKFAAKVNGCETAAKGGAKRNVMQGAAAPPALEASHGESSHLGSKRPAPGQSIAAGPKRSKLC